MGDSLPSPWQLSLSFRFSLTAVAISKKMRPYILYPLPQKEEAVFNIEVHVECSVGRAQAEAPAALPWMPRVSLQLGRVEVLAQSVADQGSQIPRH